MKSQKFRAQEFGCSMKRDEMTTKTLVSDFIAQTLISTSEIRLGGWCLIPDPDRGFQAATFGLSEFFIEQAY